MVDIYHIKRLEVDTCHNRWLKLDIHYIGYLVVDVHHVRGVHGRPISYQVVGGRHKQTYTGAVE